MRYDIIIVEHWSERRLPIPSRPGFVTHAILGKSWTTTSHFGSKRRANEIICELMLRHDTFQAAHRFLPLSAVPAALSKYDVLQRSRQ